MKVTPKDISYEKRLDIQVENQPRTSYIGRTALVRVGQYPSQTMSELTFSLEGGVTQTMSKLDNVQVETFCGGKGNSDNVRVTQDGHTDPDTGANQYQLATAADKSVGRGREGLVLVTTFENKCRALRLRGEQKSLLSLTDTKKEMRDR